MFKGLEECVESMRQYLEEGLVRKNSRIEDYYVEVEKAYFEDLDPTKFYTFTPIKPNSRILAVDVSTYTILPGVCWRIKAARVAYILLDCEGGKIRLAEEGYEDHVFPIKAESTSDVDKRINFQVWEKLRNLESRMILSKIKMLGENDVCLLDGAAYFATGDSRVEREYSPNAVYPREIYDECKNLGVRLVAIPKHVKHFDGKGREFRSIVFSYANKIKPKTRWFYYPLDYPSKEKISTFLAKSCWARFSPEALRIFRCDIADYLIERLEVEGVNRTISELSYLCDDARCYGYPAPLYLAHERTKIPEARLLEIEETVFSTLRKEGILDQLLCEAEISHFRVKQLLNIFHYYQIFEI
ncbi:MAG: DNA double-strand break repair nuclease NurA [Candidatus Bathyarchaeota archaeon]|nr:DNA double-strand break repair nuclease NurA [Candidatus Bathyarchaeota archaeon]